MCNTRGSSPHPHTVRTGSLRGLRAFALKAAGQCERHRLRFESSGTTSELQEVEEVTLPPWPQFPHLYNGVVRIRANASKAPSPELKLASGT